MFRIFLRLVNLLRVFLGRARCSVCFFDSCRFSRSVKVVFGCFWLESIV